MAKINGVAADVVLEYDGHTIEVATLPPESIVYLLRYGWSQSIQDSSAGRTGDEATQKRNERAAAIRDGKMTYAARGRRSAADAMEVALVDAAAFYINRDAAARHMVIRKKDLPERVAAWLADEANLAKAKSRVERLAAID